MKKTININLGGHPFIIDVDAYNNLEKYLDSLSVYFRDHEGSNDIMEDIELRIAELFNEESKSQKIISQKNVETIISIMGTIEDLTGEDKNEDTTEHMTYITGRKLYRDEEKSVLGGVASGLAAYFGIKNPWWIRLPFLFLTGAGTPLIYIVLWILVPAAKTSSDRLSMQGEPININTIVKTIEEELLNLKDKIEDIGRDLKAKKKK